MYVSMYALQYLGAGSTFGTGAKDAVSPKVLQTTHVRYLIYDGVITSPHLNF